MEAVALSEDRGGRWLGLEAGWVMQRAARTLTIPYACVLYVPQDRGFLARFADREADTRAPLYVDITTVPQWVGNTARMIDLDLDVVRDASGNVEVVDEDEFVANTQRLNYPAQVVASAPRWAQSVMEMIHAAEPPFGDEAQHVLGTFVASR